MKLKDLIAKLPADKVAHLKGGVLVAAAMLITVLLAVYVGLWAGLAFGVCAVNVGVEVYQRKRREGTSSWGDAATGSLPGLVVAGALLTAGL